MTKKELQYKVVRNRIESLINVGMIKPMDENYKDAVAAFIVSDDAERQKAIKALPARSYGKKYFRVLDKCLDQNMIPKGSTAEAYKEIAKLEVIS